MIGIVGGTGLLGRLVAQRLHADGFPVRVIGKTENRDFKRAYPRIEFFPAEVGDIASLRRALQGCTSVHVSLSGGPSASSYRDVEENGVKNILRVGENQGWTCLTMMSGSSQGMGRPQHASFAAKANAELAIQASGLPYGIIRSSFVLEGLERFVRGKRANYLGPGKQKFHWVSGEDVARLVATIHSGKMALNRIIYAYGPEKLSLREALTRYCQSHHPGVKVQGAPFWLMEWVGRLTKNADLVNVVNFLRDIETRGEPEAVENGLAWVNSASSAMNREIRHHLDSNLLSSPSSQPSVTHT